jgi:hypothetical protein
MPSTDGVAMGKAENQAAASRRLFSWRDGDATDHIRWLETALSECQHDLLWLGETKEEPSDTDVLVLLVTESLDRTELIINELVNEARWCRSRLRARLVARTRRRKSGTYTGPTTDAETLRS